MLTLPKHNYSFITIDIHLVSGDPGNCVPTRMKHFSNRQA